MAHDLGLFTSSVTLRLVTAYVALPQIRRFTISKIKPSLCCVLYTIYFPVYSLQRTDEIVCPLGLESITIRGLVDYILEKLES